jgi:hypothetical protein
MKRVVSVVAAMCVAAQMLFMTGQAAANEVPLSSLCGSGYGGTFVAPYWVAYTTSSACASKYMVCTFYVGGNAYSCPGPAWSAYNIEYSDFEGAGSIMASTRSATTFRRSAVCWETHRIRSREEHNVKSSVLSKLSVGIFVTVVSIMPLRSYGPTPALADEKPLSSLCGSGYGGSFVYPYYTAYTTSSPCASKYLACPSIVAAISTPVGRVGPPTTSSSTLTPLTALRLLTGFATTCNPFAACGPTRQTHEAWLVALRIHGGPVCG